jgi:hypothetical protein
MIAWTDTARRVLEDYCQRTRHNLRGSGADAEEVVDDLRRHFEEEICAAKLSVVTEEDVRRILARIGEPAADSSQRPNAPKRPGRFFLAIAILFGVLLPLGTLAFEMFTGISAGVLFDPIPTWFHVVAVAFVPVVNFWLCRVTVTGKCRHPRLAGWLSGAAMGVALYYSILYLPFVPIAGMAVIYFGLGLIPLSPYLALLFTLLLRWRVGGSLADARVGRFWSGFTVAFAALVLSQVPMMLTYNGLSRAVSDDPATQRGGVNMLRHFGDRELLLRYCYGFQRERDVDFDVVHLLASGSALVSADQAREIYFRVTGRPFNSVPPPSLYTRLGRWNVLEDEFTWDEALGGEAVAGRVKGLSLQTSRMDAVAEPDAAVVYCEWTLEFKNISSQQREARAQINLPPGGVVSRLTLWVNGEEREAAFGGRSQTRVAYQNVGVVQRHDPVLVTTCGPDCVLMQCFPVPPNGGTMKVRLGITSPLALESFGRGRYVWPKFLERNFKLAPEFKHAVWMESPQKLASLNSGLTVGADPQSFSLHGALADDALGSVLVDRPSDTLQAWTPALEPGQIIRQRIEGSSPPPVSRIVFVIDGSAGMGEWRTGIAEALSKVPAGTEVAVVIAGDEPFALNTPPTRVDTQFFYSLNERLQNFRFVGGRDNLPALEQAWDLAAASDHGAVVWIHDTQPVLLSSADSLRQRLEHSVKSVPIYDLQLRSGPNHIAEKLDGLSSLVLIPRFSGSIPGDLENLFEIFNSKIHQFGFVRERVANSSADSPGKQVSRHIERLWARDEASRLADGRRHDDAAQLAASHQIVTPFSGAVVLETKQQYTQNNLTPASANTVPTVPEPKIWTLMILGMSAVIWLRLKRRNTA